jgi:ATP-binding cassette subfamily B protein
VVRQNSLGALITLALLMLIAAVVTGVFKTLRSYIFTDVANRIDQATKSVILDRLVRLPQGFFDSRPVGQVMFYFNQLDRLREFLVGQSITTFVDFGFSFIYLVVLLMISLPLTLVSLATLPLMLALAVISNPLVRRQIKRSLGESVRTFSYLNESITGIQTLKSQNAELKTRWEFQNRYASFIGEDFKLKITREALTNVAEFINSLNNIVVAGVGVYLIMKSELSFGGFIAFRILSGYITAPLVRLVQTWQQFEQSTASIQMVADVVDRPTEQSEQEAMNIPMPPLRGDVRFESVEFSYGQDLPPILDGVNLEVPAGAFVGLVGGSGSGKSTLLKLLPRFYSPSRGRVLIDGFDIAKLELYSLRRQIGVVPQDSVLFDGTIRDNLLLVKPDASAEEMIAAARMACAHDFIMDLPKGYNSDVGERGAGLSGGQRQRLALARAVLQNPRLLILDEATSALDARTERQVCLNLLEAFRGRTVFFITHRLTTVQPADLIVLMDRGAVMEVGDHRELMRRQGWYYALYQSQVQEAAV